VTNPSASTAIATRPSAPRPYLFIGALAAYGALLLAAFVSGNRWLAAAASLTLATLLLAPGLRRRNVLAFALWLCSVAVLGAFALRGEGRVDLDLMPVLINIALCHLFGRSLLRGREPLIARVIDVLEGPQRLALPGVAAYARQLTWVWTLVSGAQALVLTLLILCVSPDGVLPGMGISLPFEISSEWRWALHFCTYATVIGLLIGEYAFRRWHMRHVPHAPLPVFIARLAQRWPALVRRIADDAD
jgi:uncharacterized membrane protein